MIGQTIFSVAAVNRNTRDQLLECLESIKRQNVGDARIEIVVVDNASADGSVEAARRRFPDIVIIQNARPMGFTIGANQALARCRGQYVLLTQPDITMLDTRSLVRLAAYLETREDVAAVVPRYLCPDGSFQRLYNDFPTLAAMCVACTHLARLRLLRQLPAVRRYFLDDVDFDQPFEVPQPGLSCALIRKRAIEQVGLLDERFPLYFSDVDWCLRLHWQSQKILYVPDVCVVHDRGSSTRTMGEHQWMHSVGSVVRYFRKHRGALETAVLQVVLGSSLLTEKALLGWGELRQRPRFGPKYRIRDIWLAIGGWLPDC